jgi:hypothetical protein
LLILIWRVKLVRSQSCHYQQTDGHQYTWNHQKDEDLREQLVEDRVFLQVWRLLDEETEEDLVHEDQVESDKQLPDDELWRQKVIEFRGLLRSLSSDFAVLLILLWLWRETVDENRSKKFDHEKNEGDGKDQGRNVQIEHHLLPVVHQVRLLAEVQVFVQCQLVVDSFVVPVAELQVPQVLDLFLVDVFQQHEVKEAELESVDQFDADPVLREERNEKCDETQNDEGQDQVIHEDHVVVALAQSQLQIGSFDVKLGFSCKRLVVIRHWEFQVMLDGLVHCFGVIEMQNYLQLVFVEVGTSPEKRVGKGHKRTDGSGNELWQEPDIVKVLIVRFQAEVQLCDFLTLNLHRSDVSQSSPTFEAKRGFSQISETQETRLRDAVTVASIADDLVMVVTKLTDSSDAISTDLSFSFAVLASVSSRGHLVPSFAGTAVVRQKVMVHFVALNADFTLHWICEVSQTSDDWLASTVPGQSGKRRGTDTFVVGVQLKPWIAWSACQRSWTFRTSRKVLCTRLTLLQSYIDITCHTVTLKIGTGRWWILLPEFRWITLCTFIIHPIITFSRFTAMMTFSANSWRAILGNKI